MATNRESLSKAFSALSEISVGQSSVIRKMLCALLSGGHVLLEDLPGSGKTTLAKSMASVIGGTFKRIQATPDLMPSDALGASLFNPVSRSFDLVRGPVFCNVLLVDEINRASPRTQSALLEAMGEGQVSIDGQTLELAQPFFVVATQNPADMHGTYPLPEAQLDRFSMRLRLDRLSVDEETDVLLMNASSRTPAERLSVLSSARLGEGIITSAQCEAMTIPVSRSLSRYVADMVRATREHKSLSLGASTRAAISLVRCAQALAWLEDCPHTLPRHVTAMAVDCLAHRLKLSESARISGVSTETIVSEIVASNPVTVEI